MAPRAKIPQTPAVRVLHSLGVPFTPHFYEYEERGGAAHAAEVLGLPLHQVVKTVVFEDERGNGVIVLQHGDRDSSAQALARELGVKSLRPCHPDKVTRLTGYKVGGTSPFGIRKGLPVYVEASVLALPEIYLNGGKRGFLMGMAPAALEEFLHARAVRVAISKKLTDKKTSGR